MSRLRGVRCRKKMLTFQYDMKDIDMMETFLEIILSEIILILDQIGFVCIWKEKMVISVSFLLFLYGYPKKIYFCYLVNDLKVTTLLT